MRWFVERRCLYPIIKYIPILRPLAGALISPIIRRSIKNPPLMYLEGLRHRMEKQGVSLEVAYRSVIEELMQGDDYEHIPVCDAAYRRLKRERKTRGFKME